MFPIHLKWIDDIYDKIESVCCQVDDIVSKEEESKKYIEGLKNVGNNVKQFCSTMDPLKYVEDQLTNVGTKVDELYSCIVPSSVDTMLSAVNSIFPVQDSGSTVCANSELSDSVAEPVTYDDMNEEVASTEKFENSKLDLEDNIMQTDQYFDEDSAPILDDQCIDEDPSAGFCSPGQTAEVELIEETIGDDGLSKSPEKVQLDESCIVIDKNHWFTSQVSVGIESPEVSMKISTPNRVKLPLLSTSKFRLIQRHQQMKKKSKFKSSISKEDIIEIETAFSPSTTSSDQDTWDSEWEII